MPATRTLPLRDFECVWCSRFLHRRDAVLGTQELCANQQVHARPPGIGFDIDRRTVSADTPAIGVLD